MAETPPLRLEWKIPSWILTIDPMTRHIYHEGGFSRSDSVAALTLEEFLTDIAFQKEIGRNFGAKALEEALATARQLLAKT